MRGRKVLSTQRMVGPPHMIYRSLSGSNDVLKARAKSVKLGRKQLWHSLMLGDIS